MTWNMKFIFAITFIFPCNGISWRRQLEHIAQSRLQSLGGQSYGPYRRFYEYDPREIASILGIPSRPSHLPEAEPILPGHTLLKPALGMLKSSVKYPHRDMEDGAGVYGNNENLGLRYDGRNERLLYTGFRRSPMNYVLAIPSKGPQYDRSRLTMVPNSLDLKHKEIAPLDELQKILQTLSIHKGVHVFGASLNEDDSDKSNDMELSRYLNMNQPDRYNSNKVKQRAPEISDIIASEDDEIRKWWFNNANDK